MAMNISQAIITALESGKSTVHGQNREDASMWPAGRAHEQDLSRLRTRAHPIPHEHVRLYAPSRHDHGVAVGKMISTKYFAFGSAPFPKWSATKLTADNNKGLIKHPVLLSP